MHSKVDLFELIVGHVRARFGAVCCGRRRSGSSAQQIIVLNKLKSRLIGQTNVH